MLRLLSATRKRHVEKDHFSDTPSAISCRLRLKEFFTLVLGLIAARPEFGEVFSCPSSLSSMSLMVQTATVIEIVFDNAKSHAEFSTTSRHLESTSRGRQDGIRVREDDAEMDISDLKIFPSIDYSMHNSFPGRNNMPGHAENLCRWATSSDSDFAYAPSIRSFDRMLKEDSSGTKSARTNVSRPVRRTSLKTSSFSHDSGEKVLNSLCSNMLENFAIAPTLG